MKNPHIGNMMDAIVEYQAAMQIQQIANDIYAAYGHLSADTFPRPPTAICGRMQRLADDLMKIPTPKIRS